MSMNNFWKIVCLGLIFLAISFSAVSRQAINFQGYLTDKNGQPVFGSRQMSFNIYTDATNATVLFPIGNRVVTVYNGNYSTKLELMDSQLAQLAADATGQIWLEVSVDGVTMNPRIQMVAVPFAANVRGLPMNGLNEITAATINAAARVINNGTISGGTINVAVLSANTFSVSAITTNTLAASTITSGLVTANKVVGAVWQ